MQGWFWLKQSFKFLRQRPLELLGLFFLFSLLQLIVSIIPALGQIVLVLLWPAFSFAFMFAYSQIELGKKLPPKLLFVGFKSPQLGRLCALGAVYFILIVIAVKLTSLIDDGRLIDYFYSAQQGNTPKEIDPIALQTASVLAATIVVIELLFWYATPLIVWQKMSLFKALFYSIFLVKKNFIKFLIFGASWFVICFLGPQQLMILTIISGVQQLALFIVPVWIALMYLTKSCVNYLSYVDAFGIPAEELHTQPNN